MQILFTLCGRAGSKGFKNKNLKMFLDRPLLFYSVAAINGYIKTHQEDVIDTVLNTDSEKLISLMTTQKQIDFEIIRREISLGGDTVPKVAVIRDCLVRMEKLKNRKYDMVVDLDITSPLRTIKNVENAIQKKYSRKDVDVVFSVTESRRNPYFNMVKKDNGFYSKAIASNFTARQQAPKFFDMNASIYAYSPDALMNKEPGVFFNDKCDIIEMKDTGILDIDSEEDFELMQVIAGYLFENDAEFGELRKNIQGLEL